MNRMRRVRKRIAKAARSWINYHKHEKKKH